MWRVLHPPVEVATSSSLRLHWCIAGSSLVYCSKELLSCESSAPPRARVTCVFAIHARRS
jgi:hypothetical protein